MQALGPERFIRRPAAGSNNIVISVCVLCQKMVAATDSLDLLTAIEHLHICSDAKKTPSSSQTAVRRSNLRHG
ncbi:MAG TPA: hypothetical protein VE994_06535 [Terriglobales bacterium]|nr:hypothetical protein [Terriglobales bacterium]